MHIEITILRQSIINIGHYPIFPNHLLNFLPKQGNMAATAHNHHLLNWRMFFGYNLANTEHFCDGLFKNLHQSMQINGYSERRVIGQIGNSDMPLFLLRLNYTDLCFLALGVQ